LWFFRGVCVWDIWGYLSLFNFWCVCVFCWLEARVIGWGLLKEISQTDIFPEAGGKKNIHSPGWSAEESISDIPHRWCWEFPPAMLLTFKVDVLVSESQLYTWKDMVWNKVEVIHGQSCKQKLGVHLLNRCFSMFKIKLFFMILATCTRKEATAATLQPSNVQPTSPDLWNDFSFTSDTVDIPGGNFESGSPRCLEKGTLCN